MEFYDVIQTRRSVRRFLKRAVGEDALERVLDAARIAPSGGDRQPWRFVVIKEEQKKKRIARACYDQDFVAEAPVVLVCCAIKCSSGYEPWHDEAGRRDAVIAIDHLILAARNEGLGTCWVGAVHDKQVKKIVNVPDDVDVVMVVPIGYPASKTAFRKASGRKKLKEICFLEEYGRKQ
jgi:nitroreductase